MSSGGTSGSCGGEMSKRRAVPGPSAAASGVVSAIATAGPSNAAATVAVSGIGPQQQQQQPPVVTPDLASLFECPVCFDYVLPPILQCQSGHLVCSSCRPKLSCCPTCRGALGNIRNLAMEKVASTVMFPCKYASTGCAVLQLYADKVEHEEVCEFRPFQCPCPGASCKWLGSLDQVMPHLVMSHKSITTLQGEDIVFLATDINLPGAVDWVMMQSCFGHCFMLVLEKQEKFDGHQQFFALVQLIGSRKQAENFGYRLELNRQRRRLTWEATPRSIHEGIASAIVSSDCLVFDTSVAQLFADNGNLGINVTISIIILFKLKDHRFETLWDLRATLMENVAYNLFTTLGYNIIRGENNVDDNVKVITFGKSSMDQTPNSHIKVLCNRVKATNVDGRTDINIDEYQCLRKNDMKSILEQKYWNSVAKETVDTLAEAAITIDLLQISPKLEVKLSLEHTAKNNRSDTNKGGPFILYNIARLYSIQKSYKNKNYPALPPIDEVNFLLLAEDEEWLIVFDYLLEYPKVLQECIAMWETGNIYPNRLCKFIFGLCSALSAYYSRIRVLQEPKPHLLPTIFSRMNLIRAIEIVLLNALQILNIKSVEYM